MFVGTWCLFFNILEIGETDCSYKQTIKYVGAPSCVETCTAIYMFIIIMLYGATSSLFSRYSETLASKEVFSLLYDRSNTLTL